MLASLLSLVALQSVNVTIDATSSTSISPYIYGVNFPDWEKLGKGFTLARQGGNRMSAYNWETNASNAGADYHHQNDGYMGESNEPGWTMRTFFQPAQRNGAAVLLTIPTLGYVSADKNADGDVNKTPNYLQTRFHKSLASKPGGKWEFPPNTKDKVVYQDEAVAWVEKTKAKNTPVWYSLDNEPDIWAHTHARIAKHPTYAEFIANNIEYALAIKGAAKDTLVFGPASYGWQGFRTFQDAKDANGRDFLDVYLAAMRDAERKHGKRLLDVLDIHWYPEARGGGLRVVTNEDKPGTAEARIQAPRSLWDPTYVEDSWIAENLGKKPIVLLPGLRRQIARQYPGTKLAITEYDFGGGKNISGALAQADVLGLWGRYGLFAASHWGLDAADDPYQLAGFRAFIDYDRKGSRFGDLGLEVAGVPPAEASVYAALDSKDRRRMTVVLINKTPSPRAFALGFRAFPAASGRAFVVRSGAHASPVVSAVAVRDGRASFTLPALSLATLELRR